MRLSRRPLWHRISKLAPAVAGLLIASAGPGGASGLELGRTGLPSSWIGEAFMVSLAFALPAIVAGLTITLRRLLFRAGPKDAFRPRL